ISTSPLPYMAEVVGPQPTWILQDCPGPRLPAQVFDWLNPSLLTAILSIAIVSLQVFVRMLVSGGVQMQLEKGGSRIQPNVRVGGSTVASVPDARHDNVAAPCKVAPLPADDAVTVTGPPIVLQVATPLLESIVAIPESDRVQCAGSRFWT